jgi:hypothetical protein
MLLKNFMAASPCSARNPYVNAKFRLRAGGLAALVFLFLSGCTSFGLKTRLEKISITALSATLSPGPGLAPGKSARLVIVATTTDGKELATVGPGQGEVLFDNFTFETTVARVSKEGVVSLPADPRVSEGQWPHVRITAIGHPDIVANLDIPVRYDADFKADFSGQAGADGANGASGIVGADGLPCRNGENGGPGFPGQDGADGKPGKTVRVWLTLKTGSHPLLQARVASDADEKFFLIDPNGGSLEVDANGGTGGKGGAGGEGGSGGAAGACFASDGTPVASGSAGRDGRPGRAGLPGPGGAAGTIVVSVDPLAKLLLYMLHLSNHSGDGVPGHAPEIRVEPVPAIW